jgi:hypothetical protein
MFSIFMKQLGNFAQPVGFVPPSRLLHFKFLFWNHPSKSLYYIHTHTYIYIKWSVHPLLSNDREISSYSKAVPRKWQQQTRTQQSVPRLYNDEQLRWRESLETAVGRVAVHCEVVAGQWAREDGSWGSYGIRRRPQATTSEDTADWEDFVHAVVNCRTC